MFKNIIVYKIEDDFPQITSEKLKEVRFKPCEGLDYTRMGFISCFEENDSEETKDDFYAYKFREGLYLLKVKKQEKILPSYVVNDFLKEKIEKRIMTTGFSVSKSEEKNLKDEIITDLLPKSFSKYKYNYVWIDYNNKLLYIDAASFKHAEDILSLLRKPFGALNVSLFLSNYEDLDLTKLMTEWLREEKTPDKFFYLDKATLEDDVAGGKVVLTKEDLNSKNVKTYLDSGKSVSSLLMSYDKKIKFNLKNDFVISQIKNEDMELEFENDVDNEEYDKFNTDLFVSTTNITNLLLAFDKVFKQNNKTN